MRYHASLVTALLAAVALASTGAAQEPPATIDSVRAQLARQMLQRMQAADQIIQAMEQALQTERRSNAEVPAVFWDRFVQRVRERKDELVELMVPIYAAAFTADELSALLQFFDTPIGRRLAETQAQITTQAAKAGERWGAKLAASVIAELIDEGVEFPN